MTSAASKESASDGAPQATNQCHTWCLVQSLTSRPGGSHMCGRLEEKVALKCVRARKFISKGSDVIVRIVADGAAAQGRLLGGHDGVRELGGGV